MARVSTRSAAIVVGAICVLFARTEALQVVSPSEGMTVAADKPFEVEWTGADEDARFDIDLFYCGSYSFCFDDDCGFYLASLCPKGNAGCLAEDGGVEVMMPEPIVPGSGYRLRISEVGGDAVRCSNNFYLISSGDSTTGTEASIMVTSPASESVAIAGEEYTVEFEYDNGMGSSVGRFMLDLYEDAGTGDCGTWVTSICDKADRGCKDSEGDYNIVIPESTSSGMYRIRVGLFGDHTVYSCSEVFEVLVLSDIF